MEKPFILEERCVRGLSRLIGCKACINACPDKAIGIQAGGDEISISSACSGCNLCCTLCPSEAVRPSGGPIRGHEGELAVICRKTDEYEGKLPDRVRLKLSCARELDFRFLLAAWAAGVRRVVVYGADCSGCELLSGRADSKDGFVRVNRILSVSGRELLEMTCDERPLFQKGEKESGSVGHADLRVSRREFFKDMVATTLEPALSSLTARPEDQEQIGEEKGKGTTAFLDALDHLSREREEKAGGRLAAYGIHVSDFRCYGCRVCATLCPTGALSWVADGESPSDERLEIDPSRCHGCNACRDLCDVGAIRIEFDPDFRVRKSIPFVEKKCQVCGRTFLSPSAIRHHCPGCRMRDQGPSLSGPVLQG